MACYPIMLNIEGKKCLVVGGGSVAARKVRGLLECGAHVAVIAPSINEEIRKLRENGRISIVERNYMKGDVDGYFLAVAASGDRNVNKRVALEASERNILVNVADDMALSSFTAPSVVRRGDLAVAISTGGRSPLLAKVLKNKLERILTEEYEELLNRLWEVRQRVKAQEFSEEEKTKMYSDIIEDYNLICDEKEG
ncbi:MAG: bifunctional precorrin-2 dehydrogenase/sirohydrochlorin ferrochelatase [Tepidanaerobacteraceae bacterium]|nr:bifunctional precorrin-2 dehydrogenase/sirohydrochlorin ferrochelatase [Tepidanaerobacteraceae bacterium]